MKQKSFVKRIVLYTSILLFMLMVLLVGFSVYSLRSSQKESRKYGENLLDVYCGNLEKWISGMDTLMKNVIFKTQELSLLKSQNEAVRLYASLDLKQYMKELLTYNECADAILISDEAYDINLNYQYAKSSMPYSQVLLVRERIKDYLDEEFFETDWEFQNIGGVEYLYKVHVYNHQAIGVFVQKQRLMDQVFNEELDGLSFLLADKGGTVRAAAGAGGAEWCGRSFEEPGGTDSWTFVKGIGDTGLSIAALMERTGAVWKIQGSLLVFIVMILSIVVLSAFLIRYLTREVLGPMTHLMGTMEKIEKGDYNCRVEENCHNREFTSLKENFNRLMDEIIGLKIQRYEKQLSLQESELRCIRLQLKPHFFLNALTTISSLCGQGKTRQAQEYIQAFCGNIRYMFRSGFHTVPVKEEIRHVENYLEMQEMKYPECVFYFINIPEELEEWRIPQMLIHTFVENEYKYAVNVESTLTILITAARTEKDGEEYLLLEMEDDGPGYPEEVLEWMEEENPQPAGDGSRVGLSSICRMMELMYDKKNLVSIENVEPHGCRNRVLIPKEPINEMPGRGGTYEGTDSR
ncbi:sensor histidine kinase [Murimonas intestini]|uniref:sensor histidine kinase n=1 Tax=Murimonas intestini TaxID=1337051 RepID=UPI0011DE4A59|nr:histidine kinase [Murimonas intestini]